MSRNQSVLDYLSSRRSVTLPFLAEPGPNAAEIDTLFQIATRVPDHGKLAPWRLVTFEGDARQIAGEGLAEIFAQKNPNATAEQIEIEKNQFLPAPLTVAVISAPKAHPKVPAYEQLLSAGCVAMNLVHGANALGYAAHWVTRWFSFDEDAASYLGLRDGEQFVGFVHIGTPETRLEERDRPLIADIVSRWSPSA